MQVYVDEVVYSISQISREWQIIEVEQNNFVITVQYKDGTIESYIKCS